MLTGGVVTPASIAKPTGTLLTGGAGGAGVATTPKPGGGRPGGPIKMLE